MIDIDTPLFASLPERALERIRQAVTTRHFAPGQVMLEEGELAGELFIILTGEALVLGRDLHGQQQVLARLRPGECFGELSMLSGEPASATVEAATGTDVWILPQGDFVAIASEHPELERNLSTLLAERLRLSNKRLLRAQRGKLVALVAPGEPPWALRLAYRLARSVAKHTRRPVTFFDVSGQAQERLRLELPVRSLQEAAGQQVRAKAPTSADCLQVVVPDATAPAADAQSVAALEHLQEQARFVLAFLPEHTPAAEPILRRADTVLVLIERSQVDRAAELLASSPVPSQRPIEVVLLSDEQSAPTNGDLRRAQSSLEPGWRVRGIIPGGAQALEGDLPGDSLIGRAVDRMARSIAGLTVGLALGGGGAKGYAHLGVVKALQRAGVPFDCVTGCSIGAPIATGIAAGWSLDRIRTNLDSVSQKAVRPNVPLVSLLTSRSIRAELRSVTENARFEDLPTPLGIVAVDIETGEEVLLRSGLVWPAMVASMAFPGIYEPVRLGRRYLVDGGVLNPVPVSAAVTLGAHVVISSNLSSSPHNGHATPPITGPKRRRFILENIARSLEIMQSKIVTESCSRADVAIEPVFAPPPGLLDFKHGRQFEQAGEESVEQALPKLRSLLPWLT